MNKRWSNFLILMISCNWWCWYGAVNKLLILHTIWFQECNWIMITLVSCSSILTVFDCLHIFTPIYKSAWRDRTPWSLTNHRRWFLVSRSLSWLWLFTLPQCHHSVSLLDLHSLYHSPILRNDLIVLCSLCQDLINTVFKSLHPHCCPHALLWSSVGLMGIRFS